MPSSWCLKTPHQPGLTYTFSATKRSGPILQHGTLTWDPDPDSMTKCPGHAFKLVSQNASPTKPDTFSATVRSGPILQHGTLTWDPDPDSMTELPGHAFKLVSQNASPTRPDMSAVVMLPSCQSTQSVTRTSHRPDSCSNFRDTPSSWRLEMPPPPGLALFR